MPPKSKSRSPEPPRTRAGLLAAYALSDRTLRLLTDGGALRLTPVAADGMVRYVVDDDADFTLRTARCCPYSFDGPRPPYLRFVLMRLLSSSVSDVIEDLSVRGLLRTDTEAEAIAAIERKMIETLPEPLAALIKAKRRPTTEDERRAWDLLLRIIKMYAAFNAPEWLETFYFQDEARLHLLNQVLLTSDASAEARAYTVNYAVGDEMITPAGVLWYANCFADWSFLRPRDEKAYLASFRPSVRTAYQRARGCSLAQFVALADIACGTTHEISYLSRELTRRVHDVLASGSETALATATRLVQTILKLDDHLGRMNPGAAGRELPKDLAEIVPEGYDFDAVVKLPPEFSDPTRQAENG